jgi:hypothetical protein
MPTPPTIAVRTSMAPKPDRSLARIPRDIWVSPFREFVSSPHRSARCPERCGLPAIRPQEVCPNSDSKTGRISINALQGARPPGRQGRAVRAPGSMRGITPICWRSPSMSSSAAPTTRPSFTLNTFDARARRSARCGNARHDTECTPRQVTRLTTKPPRNLIGS